MVTTTFRVSEAAALLAVSDDTIRRWAESGRLTLERDGSGPQHIAGTELARVAQEIGEASTLGAAFPTAKASTRNRVTGIVTRVVRDTVMAQVELQPGRSAWCRSSAARPPTSSSSSRARSPSPP